MTHIGYIYIFNKFERKGVIIDSHKFAHMFEAEGDTTFSPNQFVTYEGEEEVVEDVIALESYPRYQTYQKDKTFYIQDGTGSWYKYYLVNKAGERYALNGPESFIVGCIFRGDKLEPSNLSPYSEDENGKEVNRILEAVEYVSTNLRSIADSYQVNIVIRHISKVGGDDRFYVDRQVDLSYRDSYINEFFLKDENLVSERGYTSHFEHSYKKGRQFDIEERDRSNFLLHYDKNKHLLKLLYEMNVDSRGKVEHEMNKCIRYAVNWGLRRHYAKSYDGESAYYDEFEFWQNITLESIRKFNNRGMQIID